jgi:predicted nucleotidyltransferase
VPHPSDLDILVVYDPTVVPPARAYEAYEPLREELGITTGLPVDMTLLTVSEEAALRFVESEHCVEILTKGD